MDAAVAHLDQVARPRSRSARPSAPCPGSCPGPANVPVTVHRTRAALVLRGDRDDPQLEVGEGGVEARRSTRAARPARRRSATPTIAPTPPGSHSEMTVSRSRRSCASKYARATSSVVAAALGRGAGHLQTPGYRAAPMAEAERKREVGRGRARAPRRVAPAAPAPLAGRAALQRVGARRGRRHRARGHGDARARLARPPRARAGPGPPASSSTCACWPARTPTPTTTARPRPILERAGCELWMHPNHEHMTQAAQDPEAALAAAPGGGAPVRRARGAAAPLRRGAQGPGLRDRRARRARPRPGRGRDDRHRPRPLARLRDPGPRPLARLPLPARPAAAHLRRPPARAACRCTTTTAGRRTRPASSWTRWTRSDALDARLCLSGHGKPVHRRPRATSRPIATWSHERLASRGEAPSPRASRAPWSRSCRTSTASR